MRKLLNISFKTALFAALFAANSLFAQEVTTQEIKKVPVGVKTAESDELFLVIAEYHRDPVQAERRGVHLGRSRGAQNRPELCFPYSGAPVQRGQARYQLRRPAGHDQ